MDPITAVGAVASIITLAQTALSLSKALYTLGSAVQSASEDIEALADDLKTFSQSLNLLSRLLEDSKSWYSDDVYLLTAKIIKDCADLYEKIDKILVKLGGNGKNTWRIRMKFVYKEGQIRKLMRRLRDMKGNLATVLMSLQVDLQLSLLNISSSSKIQRSPEKELDSETIRHLKAAQSAVESCNFLPNYSSESNENISDEKIHQARVIDEPRRLRSFAPFNDTHSFIALSGNHQPSEPATQVVCKSTTSPLFAKLNPANQDTVDKSEFQSLRSVSSTESFKSAVSVQKELLDLAHEVKAVKSVLHAFCTALNTLDNLIEQRIPKRDACYPVALQLKATLFDGQKEVEDTNLSHCKNFGIHYVKKCEDANSVKLYEISMHMMRAVVTSLHMLSAEHEVLKTPGFHALHQVCEECRQETVAALHEVAYLASSQQNITLTCPDYDIYNQKPQSPNANEPFRIEVPETRLSFIGYTFKRYDSNYESARPELMKPGSSPMPMFIPNSRDPAGPSPPQSFARIQRPGPQSSNSGPAQQSTPYMVPLPPAFSPVSSSGLPRRNPKPYAGTPSQGNDKQVNMTGNGKNIDMPPPSLGHGPSNLFGGIMAGSSSTPVSDSTLKQPSAPNSPVSTGTTDSLLQKVTTPRPDCSGPQQTGNEVPEMSLPSVDVFMKRFYSNNDHPVPDQTKIPELEDPSIADVPNGISPKTQNDASLSQASASTMHSSPKATGSVKTSVSAGGMDSLLEKLRVAAPQAGDQRDRRSRPRLQNSDQVWVSSGQKLSDPVQSPKSEEYLLSLEHHQPPPLSITLLSASKHQFSTTYIPHGDLSGPEVGIPGFGRQEPSFTRGDSDRKSRGRENVHEERKARRRRREKASNPKDSPQESSLYPLGSPLRLGPPIIDSSTSCGDFDEESDLEAATGLEAMQVAEEQDGLGNSRLSANFACAQHQSHVVQQQKRLAKHEETQTEQPTALKRKNKKYLSLARLEGNENGQIIEYAPMKNPPATFQPAIGKENKKETDNSTTTNREDDLDKADEDDTHNLHTQRRWDEHITRDDEIEESDDEEKKIANGVCVQPGTPKRRNVIDYQDPNTVASDVEMDRTPNTSNLQAKFCSRATNDQESDLEAATGLEERERFEANLALAQQAQINHSRQYALQQQKQLAAQRTRLQQQQIEMLQQQQAMAFQQQNPQFQIQIQQPHLIQQQRGRRRIMEEHYRSGRLQNGGGPSQAQLLAMQQAQQQAHAQHGQFWKANYEAVVRTDMAQPSHLPSEPLQSPVYSLASPGIEFSFDSIQPNDIDSGLEPENYNFDQYEMNEDQEDEEMEDIQKENLTATHLSAASASNTPVSGGTRDSRRHYDSAIDPMMFQVADDAFPSATTSPQGHRRYESVPKVVTVEREPEFAHIKNPPSNRRVDYSHVPHDLHEADFSLSANSDLYDSVPLPELSTPVFGNNLETSHHGVSGFGESPEGKEEGVNLGIANPGSSRSLTTIPQKWKRVNTKEKEKKDGNQRKKTASSIEKPEDTPPALFYPHGDLQQIQTQEVTKSRNGESLKRSSRGGRGGCSATRGGKPVSGASSSHEDFNESFRQQRDMLVSKSGLRDDENPDLWSTAYESIRSSKDIGYIVLSIEMETLGIEKRPNCQIAKELSKLVGDMPTILNYDPEFADVLATRDNTIAILKMVDQQLGFELALVGWSCVWKLLSNHEDLLSPENEKPISTLKTTYAQLLEITGLIARYAVMENLYRNSPKMTLKPEYKSSLHNLCLTMLFYFSSAFELRRAQLTEVKTNGGMNEAAFSKEHKLGLEKQLQWRCGTLSDEIRVADDFCRGFKVVVDVKEDSESEISDLEGSDGSWEQIGEDEGKGEGIIV